MATPDDDSNVIETPVVNEAPDRSRALVPIFPVHRVPTADSFHSVAVWMKSIWPSLGWRQPA